MTQTRSLIEALGYVVIEVSNLDAWLRFATDILGLQPVIRADGAIDLRMDDHAMRVRLIAGPRDDLASAGWEVRDAHALAELASILEAAGHAVERPDREAARPYAGWQNSWHNMFFTAPATPVTNS